MNDLVLVLLVLLAVAALAGALISAGRYRRSKQAESGPAPQRVIFDKGTDTQEARRRLAAERSVEGDPAAERVVRLPDEPEALPPYTPDGTVMPPSPEAVSIHQTTSDLPGTRNTDSGGTG